MILPWCDRWSDLINKSFCVLNGGLSSRFCPSATRLVVDETIVDDYISTDPSVCNKTERKLFDIA